MSRAKFLRAGLFVAVIATGASTLAWVPGRTETGMAMRGSGGALMTALADSDGGVPTRGERHADNNGHGPTSAARSADFEGGGALSHHLA